MPMVPNITLILPQSVGCSLLAFIRWTCDDGDTSGRRWVPTNARRASAGEITRRNQVGTFEEAKGRIKKAAGDLTGNEALQEEGAQQADKGAEERQEAKARAEADAHAKRAQELAQEQRNTQRRD
jgi:uncharacterized protein YjbJ (UPF0337 family)